MVTLRTVMAVTMSAESKVGGDGNVTGTEACDDGNTVGGDGCSPACQLEICGNGIVDVGEACDDGNTVDGDTCSSDCGEAIICGDNFAGTGEECDDGNTSNGDGCSNACVVELAAMEQSMLPSLEPQQLSLLNNATTETLQVATAALTYVSLRLAATE